MTVKIRLKRMGGKKDPFFRIVVADSRSPRDGRFIDELGYYNPVKDPVVVKIDAEKVHNWLVKGVQMTETTKSLFRKEGILNRVAGEEK